jgi:phage gp29-like protein
MTELLQPGLSKSGLIDLYGRPLNVASAATKAEIAEVVARPTTAGVRQAWNNSTVAAGLTPGRLASLLQRAADGDAHDYLTLAEEMEERDWHYASELGKRKLAVMGLDRNVKPASDDPRDVEIAEAVRAEIIEDEAFEDLCAGALDALGKGYAVVEIGWSTGRRWVPNQYAWRDPRWFQWDRETGHTLRMLDTADMANGVELKPFKFAVHRPNLKMGLPVRGGLARLAAWAFLFKFYGVKDWATFAESYGQPLRLGKYDASATPKDVDILFNAVSMIGTDCAAVIPKAMEIEFIKAEGGVGSGADLYQKFAEFLDKQVSKAVVGQSGTADVQRGGGYAQSVVLDGVRGDLCESDARQLARTIRRDVIEPYVKFNYGPDAALPGLRLDTPETEDLKALSEAIAPLIDRGLKVKSSQMREKFGLEAPEHDDEVLAPQGRAVLAPADVTETPATRAQNRIKDQARAVNRVGSGDGDRMDDLAAEAMEGWTEDLDPLVEPFERLASASNSYAEFEAGIVEAAAQMDPAQLARTLGAAFFKARAHGDVHDDPEA